MTETKFHRIFLCLQLVITVCPLFQDHDAFEAKYNLGNPVAANFFRVRFSDIVDQFACVFSKCVGNTYFAFASKLESDKFFSLGVPFPRLEPGINDLPQCQPDRPFDNVESFLQNFLQPA